MHKYILTIEAIFLVIFLSLTQLSVGYDISDSMDEFIDKNGNSIKYINQDFFDCYSIKDIPDFFEIQNNDGLLIQVSKVSEVSEPIKQNQQFETPTDSPWPMYCHDARHTGRSPYSTSGNVGFDRWWFKCRNYVEGSAAIDKDGVIYFGGAEKNVKATTIYFYALFPNSTVKWKCEVDWFIDSAPAIDEDGTIYAGDRSYGYGKLYAINPNGTIKWKYHTYGEMYSSPVIGSDGTIFIGDGNNYINAINPNGTLKWRYTTGHKVYSSPAIGDDGTVYCGSHDSYLYALYPNNGTLKWKYKTGHWIRTSPCIGNDGSIYVVSLDDYLHAVYPNGTRKWITYVGAGASPTIGQDGTIYAGYDTLHAVNPIDGSVKWTFDVGGTMRGGTPCNSADGTIYVGTSGGEKLIAVNPDGTEKWHQYIGKCEFAPVIGEDGTVYIGSSVMEEVYSGAFINVGYLYAFNEKDSNAPSTPKVTGPTKVNSKKEIDYTFKSTSPLGNDVYYYIEWGDHDWTTDWWVGPIGSGEKAIISHTWSEPGTYSIRTRCKDSDNLWSDWKEKEVTVPRNRVSFTNNWFRFIDMFPILRYLLGLL